MPLGFQADIELMAETGQREKLGQNLKQVNLLFFGYTRCPDFCPMTLHRVHAAVGNDDDLRQKLRLFFISVDPTHDNPGELRRYLSQFPYARGFTGSTEEIRRVEKMFGAYSNEEQGTISHSLYLYVLNKQGKVIYLIRYDDPVEKIRDVVHKAAKL